MKQKVLSLFVILILVFGTSCSRESCNTLLQEKGKKQTCVIQLLQQIDSLSNLGECYYTIAKDYIAKTEDFSNTYPEDPMSAEFLYKAGLIAMTVAKISENQEETDAYAQKALSIFDDIQRVYPDYANIKNCILNKGVIYDDILHDYQNAEIQYRELIARYPADTLAINIKSYLQYLGKSPEEIFKQLEN
jgi:tetratricopeptide (TPR) repeat protein